MKLTNDHIATYLYEKEIGMSKNTIKTYKSILTAFIEFCGDNTDYRTQYLKYLHEKKVSQNYKCLMSVVILHFLEYYKIENISNVPKPKRIKKERQALTEEELNELLCACVDEFEYSIIYILSHTGLRVNEFVHLKFSDVNFSNHTIHVEKGKGSKQRTVPVSKETLDVIKSCKKYDEQEYVITHNSPTNISQNKFITTRTIEHIVQIIRGRTNIQKPVTPHVLRHTYATILIKKGLQVTYLQKILGHSNLTTTQIYVNLVDDDIQKAFNKVIGE